MFSSECHRISVFEKTLQEFLRVMPNADATEGLQEWTEGLRFLIDLEQRQAAGGGRTELSEDEVKELRIWCGGSSRRFARPGPLVGFAVNDCSDPVLGNLLGDAERAARGLARELGVK